MSIPGALRTSAEVVEKVGEALAWIAHLSKTTSDDQAVVVLRLIGTTVESILESLGVQVSAEVVQQHLDALKAQIADNDATIDADEVETKP